MKHRFPIRKDFFTSHDGTKIAYQKIGEGKKPILLCNGLGGTVVTWKPLYDYFGKDYYFIAWDYRGLFSSKYPSDPLRMKMADHVGDMAALIEKEKIDSAMVTGWSMGVQVCLEFYRQRPKFFRALFLINGTAGYPFDTALNNPLSKYILPVLNELAHKAAPKVQSTIEPIANRLIDWKGFVGLISKLGLVHENLDSEIFQEVAKSMISADLQVYHEIMRDLANHDASDVLSKVKVPTLVIAGAEDRITPLRVAEHMAAEIPKAEFFIVPKGTHYSILEFPDIINLRVAKFLEEHYKS